MTQWTITRDYLAETVPAGPTIRNCRGVVGPAGANLTHFQLTGHPEAVRFRMFDDDGELYYEGVLVGDNLLAPLDDFGTGYAGCTTLKVWQNNRWETV